MSVLLRSTAFYAIVLVILPCSIPKLFPLVDRQIAIYVVVMLYPRHNILV